MALAVPERGVPFVISGPSGVGKSTLIRRLCQAFPELGFSVSATTRPPRAGECDGVDYYFLSEAQFNDAVAREAFLEFATVFGKSYGTLAEPVRARLDRGVSLILDIDVQGAQQVRSTMPEAVHIFLLPPSRQALLARLQQRATDSDEVIARRMREADVQLAGLPSYDYVVINDDLDDAARVLISVVRAEFARVQRRPKLVASWAASALPDSRAPSVS